MKRRTRIIQISGFKGLLMAVFIVTCLAAGFIAFPAYVAMNLWNFSAEYLTIPSISIGQGLLLWAIVAISGYIINDRNKYLMAISPKNQLSEEQVKKILDNVKLQSKINQMVIKSEIKSLDKKELSDENKEKENV